MEYKSVCCFRLCLPNILDYFIFKGIYFDNCVEYIWFKNWIDADIYDLIFNIWRFLICMEWVETWFPKNIDFNNELLCK